MSPLFVDTSAFYALADKRDANHRRACAALRSFERKRRPLITSTYVTDEIITLARYRLGHAAAVALGQRLFSSTWCRIVDISEDLRRAAWEIFCRYEDQRFSFTDCTSFALIRTMSLDEAFTFDRRDFAAAGIVAIPA